MKMNKFLKTGLVIFMSCLCNHSLLAAVTVKDSGWHWDKDENSDSHGDLGKIHWVEKGSKSYFRRDINFDTGKRKIGLLYYTCNDRDHLKPGQEYHHKEGLGGVGMSGTGWYTHGFIDILVNGFSLGNYKPEITSESKGEEANATYIWETPEAKIRMTFTAKSGDDKLFLSVKIEPKKEISSMKTTLICYPSGWGKGLSVKENYPELMNKRDRWISTSKRDVQHDRKINLELEEFWVVYYDKIWDKATKEKCCAGPCALLFPPGEPENAEVEIHNYHIRTHLSYSPGTKELNYLFWPDMGISNEEALKRMKELKVE